MYYNADETVQDHDHDNLCVALETRHCSDAQIHDKNIQNIKEIDSTPSKRWFFLNIFNLRQKTRN